MTMPWWWRPFDFRFRPAAPNDDDNMMTKDDLFANNRDQSRCDQDKDIDRILFQNRSGLSDPILEGHGVADKGR